MSLCRNAFAPVLLMLVAALLAGAPASAQRAPAMDRLFAALRVTDTMAIMRREGIDYGAGLGREMMPDTDLRGWQMRIARLYDTARMQAVVEDGLTRELTEVDLTPLLAFFESPLGARIVGLELSAREAFIDPDIEAAAKARHAAMAADGAPIIGQIDTLIADSDLVGRNVSGALNSNLMLYRGLIDGGAWKMTEDEMLRDVWSQQEAVRRDGADWIGAYLLTAYRPLDADEIDRYIALWRTDAGRALNAALFAAFDHMYEEMSYLVGRSLAEHMRAQEL